MRIAVGATPAAVRSLVLSESAWIVAIGPGLGGPTALAGAHAARALVSDVPTNAPLVLAVTMLGIAGIATLVSAWPARRAAQTNVSRGVRAKNEERRTKN